MAKTVEAGAAETLERLRGPARWMWGVPSGVGCRGLVRRCEPRRMCRRHLRAFPPSRCPISIFYPHPSSGGRLALPGGRAPPLLSGTAAVPAILPFGQSLLWGDSWEERVRGRRGRAVPSGPRSLPAPTPPRKLPRALMLSQRHLYRRATRPTANCTVNGEAPYNDAPLTRAHTGRSCRGSSGLSTAEPAECCQSGQQQVLANRDSRPQRRPVTSLIKIQYASYCDARWSECRCREEGKGKGKGKRPQGPKGLRVPEGGTET
eukprot:350594-Chlamydomonas_euryale.AAC.10